MRSIPRSAVDSAVTRGKSVAVATYALRRAPLARVAISIDGATSAAQSRARSVVDPGDALQETVLQADLEVQPEDVVGVGERIGGIFSTELQVIDELDAEVMVGDVAEAG